MLLQKAVYQLPLPSRVLGAVPREVEREREAMQLYIDRQAMEDETPPGKHAGSGRSRKKRDRALHSFVKAAKISGDSALVQGAYSDAVRHYTTGLEAGCEVLSNPKLGVFYSNRSAAYAGQGLFDLAIDDADICTALRPDWPQGWTRKGVALQGKSEVLAAIYGADSPPVRTLNDQIKEISDKIGGLQTVRESLAESPDSGFFGMFEFGGWNTLLSPRPESSQSTTRASRSRKPKKGSGRATAPAAGMPPDWGGGAQPDDKIDASLEEAVFQGRMNAQSSSGWFAVQPPPNTPSSFPATPQSSLQESRTATGRPPSWRLEAVEASRLLDLGEIGHSPSTRTERGSGLVGGEEQNHREEEGEAASRAGGPHAAGPQHTSSVANSTDDETGAGGSGKNIDSLKQGSRAPGRQQGQGQLRGIIKSPSKSNAGALVNESPGGKHKRRSGHVRGRSPETQPGGGNKDHHVKRKPGVAPLTSPGAATKQYDRKQVKFAFAENETRFIAGRAELAEEAREEAEKERMEAKRSVLARAEGIFESMRTAASNRSRLPPNLAVNLRTSSPAFGSS